MLLIQKQNTTFQGFRVTSEAKPYLKNILPRVVNSDLNLLSRDPERILFAFKKRMEEMAKALEKKRAGLDIVLSVKKGLPELSFKNKNNKRIGGPLILTELVQTHEQQEKEMFTVNNSIASLNLILESTYKWIDGKFPNTISNPMKVLQQELMPIRKQATISRIFHYKRKKTKCPDTLTGVVYKVFGQ